jgi:CTP synthase (UTP-ammonia lyase)
VTRPRVAVIGDYDATYAYHLATNQALEKAAQRLGIEVFYTWVATLFLAEKGAGSLEEFDAVWVSPGSPYHSMEGALGGIRFARETGRPLIGT